MTPTTDTGRASGIPYPDSSEIAARSQLVDLEFERGVDGLWYYAGTDVPVPGARDVTLREKVRPRQVARPEERPEAVMLSLSEIIGNPRLNWALQAGTRLRGGSEDAFVVPWAVWEERGADVVDVSVPERDGVGLMRGLARVERELRLARHRQGIAASARLRTLLFASRLGATRRATAEILGLSPTRVQQLLDDAGDEVQAEVKELEQDAARVLELTLRAGEMTEAELAAALEVSAPRFERVLHVLRLCDLVVDDGRALRLTDAGQEALRAFRRSTARARA
jgi:hypothetical protein